MVLSFVGVVAAESQQLDAAAGFLPLANVRFPLSDTPAASTGRYAAAQIPVAEWSSSGSAGKQEPRNSAVWLYPLVGIVAGGAAGYAACALSDGCNAPQLAIQFGAGVGGVVGLLAGLTTLAR